MYEYFEGFLAETERLLADDDERGSSKKEIEKS